MTESEIIFTVAEEQDAGGFTARALRYPIFTEADSLDELRDNIRKAVDSFFDANDEGPRLIRLHFVRDEVLSR